jgi:hypothetical protein
VTIKTKQSLEAHNVDASSDCLVAPVGSIFGATFEKCHNFFQKSFLDALALQRDTGTMEGHRDTGGTQGHWRDTGTPEGHWDTRGTL